MSKFEGQAFALVVALLAAVLLHAAVPAQAAETPPGDLHLVEGRWTAWDPPTDFPAGATVYTIERGDTLWALAGRFYGDPYLWPQLWEQNPYILDAHWIYPGDPLLVDVEVTTADEYAEAVQEGVVPGEDEPAARPERLAGILTAEEAAGAPVPLGAESDVYCSGYIGPLETVFPHQLVGSEHGALTPSLVGPTGDVGRERFADYDRDTVRYDLATGDVVYIDGGRSAALEPGQVLSAVAAGARILHPLERGEVVGRLYKHLARVRVLSVQEDTAIGEILESCAPVRVGDYLRLFEPQPVPLGRRTRMRPPNMPVAERELADAPVILRAPDRLVSLGQGNLVFIDRGSRDDVLPGDQFTIYRRNTEGLPPVVLGELAILSTEEETALGRILESRYVIYAGDRLARK